MKRLSWFLLTVVLACSKPVPPSGATPFSANPMELAHQGLKDSGCEFKKDVEDGLEYLECEVLSDAKEAEIRKRFKDEMAQEFAVLDAVVNSGNKQSAALKNFEQTSQTAGAEPERRAQVVKALEILEKDLAETQLRGSDIRAQIDEKIQEIKVGKASILKDRERLQALETKLTGLGIIIPTDDERHYGILEQDEDLFKKAATDEVIATLGEYQQTLRDLSQASSKTPLALALILHNESKLDGYSESSSWLELGETVESITVAAENDEETTKAIAHYHFAADQTQLSIWAIQNDDDYTAALYTRHELQTLGLWPISIRNTSRSKELYLNPEAIRALDDKGLEKARKLMVEFSKAATAMHGRGPVPKIVYFEDEVPQKELPEIVALFEKVASGLTDPKQALEEVSKMQLDQLSILAETISPKKGSIYKLAKKRALALLALWADAGFKTEKGNALLGTETQDLEKAKELLKQEPSEKLKKTFPDLKNAYEELHPE